MKVGETSIPIQTLRRRHKELLAHDPRMGTSKMDAEYAVRGGLMNHCYMRPLCNLTHSSYTLITPLIPPPPPHMQRLNELQVWEESQLQPARMPVNKPKNRFEDILPCKCRMHFDLIANYSDSI